MKHLEKPVKDPNGFTKNQQNVLTSIFESEYYSFISKLSKKVKGKFVIDSVSGNSGFILYLENGDWVLSYLKNKQLLYKCGSGKPTEKITARMFSKEYGDRSSPSPHNFPYADESNHIASEIEHSHGNRITGLAIGADSFNFCFTEGMELETMLIPDKKGRLSLSVFWEQW
ncbi:hypothetical protein KKF34_13985 [Myxococcota bacterium]|nr:hypothetical protein [Myxococcota bacterium]MBU1379661.1 hypothetical protein [Myxococcota bacterium]MBU1497982.1 hypothetical protein [Myxococcota bacterium]